MFRRHVFESNDKAELSVTRCKRSGMSRVGELWSSILFGSSSCTQKRLTSHVFRLSFDLMCVHMSWRMFLG